MKTIKYLIFLVCLVLGFLSIVGFFYGNNETFEGWQDHDQFIIQRGDLISLKNHQLINTLSQQPFYAIRLANDGHNYLLSGDLVFSGKVVSFGVLGEFQNIFGQSFYRHYLDSIEANKISETIIRDQQDQVLSIPINLLLKPDAQAFDNQETFCRLFGENQRCFWMGKLKRWILIFNNHGEELDTFPLKIS